MIRPLFSFVVLAYNQETYISEAIHSALSQSYSPLEIIICDDCSSDRTFEVAEKVAKDYRGSHQVILSRSSTNLGIAGSVNRVMEMCRGEFVVVAAGDDVSLPERAETIYRVWEGTKRRATSVFSSYTSITGDGAILEVGGLRSIPASLASSCRLRGELSRFISNRVPVVNGCTHAWSPKLFDFFGPLKSDLEDSALSFRSLANGEIHYIPQPLVKYRRHGSNVSFFAGKEKLPFESREKRLRWVNDQSIRLFEGIGNDLNTLHSKGLISAADHVRLSVGVNDMRTRYSIGRSMMDDSLIEKLFTLARAIRSGHFRCAIRNSLRLLPRPAYQTLYSWVK